MITTLENGIRVVSQETYSQMCTVGVLTNVGSRHESVTGTMHLLETMAFGSTERFDGLEISNILQDWGATRFVSHSREQTLHCIDILRPNVQKGMELLSQVVLEPLITKAPTEVEYAKEVMSFQAQEQMPELALGEALQAAAYGSDQQLGKPHFATPESIALLNAPLVEDFYLNNIRNNPGGMVVAGAGIAHDELVDMAKEYFGAIEQKPVPVTIQSTYRGGSQIVEKPQTASIYQQTLPEEELCRVALAFPVGGWHSDSMVTACVLQTLLGGGSSFSAGGPGKGMYSRMYQQVLNRYGWMESAEAFTTFADEGGLFGVSASTPVADRVPDLVTILADQLACVAIQPVGDIELSRARNMLKCNVLTQLESRLILFEDMGRQVLTYGKREDAATTCRKIDSVTAGDIQKLAREMLQNHQPTLVATGSHLDKVPTYDEVSRWFR
ncbi:LuxS/MPP-like metallohydrolase [Fragilariopsis cylindrus CCMP1102]|uniref:LuxS/MPP-like metallohydrolase n=1 Tax=Fragilariopsis cylindrus CCMP1102 TaxID=635003 RepID=A0A1E7FEE7_9STRA|nr:LuxS/MPP-like metallohydrolase [Fragilariopsis cylindrus CCMP1102]|eukprot:OEU16163.1 LuxS/MPP-like metallohydrolase [Fragilariopsis cylindrus CCMP1102]